MSADTTPDRLIALLGLRPHPEGGCYVETYRAPTDPPGGRGSVTAIYFLLTAGERSHWHSVDAVEIWLWHGGAPLELSIHDEAAQTPTTQRHRLGMNLKNGERPQAVVPVGAWQSARSLGAWSLVSCTVAPAFDFAGFTLAPPGWEAPSA
ncbi:cupin domain-containing protein [Azospirillum cavernae]|uniref:Cupin domain-containing protein n=1 Tax=Azospirillum cavernae TaxID=2320860 RepID=A0A418W1J7_9PROT|nr:cupin domain-containing protein [Azospirillum cavernae]RJF83897.1 cupin domain-containing protein [Azospirillum cavernae]